jgi:hypothetical protein
VTQKRTSVSTSLAKAALAARPSLPADPEQWGRAFNLAPGEGARLVLEEQARRS